MYFVVYFYKIIFLSSSSPQRFPGFKISRHYFFLYFKRVPCKISSKSIEIVLHVVGKGDGGCSSQPRVDSYFPLISMVRCVHF